MLQRPYSPSTELTKEQIEKARLVIPTNYWGLSCWTCRDDGYTTFTYGRLMPSQRLYITYCYYFCQCKTNVRIAEWYKQRRAAHATEGTTRTSHRHLSLPDDLVKAEAHRPQDGEAHG